MAKPKEGLVRQARNTEDRWQFVFRFLVRKEEDLFAAYCLELDLVATGKTEEEAVADLRDITIAQVSYCIANDNMDRLFRRAPEEIWTEYSACEKSAPPEPRMFTAPSIEVSNADLPPISFTASTCSVRDLCHAR